MLDEYHIIEESKTLAINSLSKELEKEGRLIYKFGFGQSPFNPPKQVLEAYKNTVSNTNYTHVQGSEELRKLISNFHKQANNIDSNFEDIFIAPGSKILIYSILLAYVSADVFVCAPSWVSYRPQVDLCGHNLINIDTTLEGNWRLTPEALRIAYENKKNKNSILILNYPGNPDGLSYSSSELMALAEVAKELDILVIADEIYALLDFNNEHESFANYYPENTITTTGLSKWCGAGGWRFGVAILSKGIDRNLKTALIGIASETYSCAPAPVQEAAKIAYRNYDEILDYLNTQIKVLKECSRYCYNSLKSIGVNLAPAAGGFYLFPEFSTFKHQLELNGITTSDEFCNQLLNDTGVALLPGTAFGMHAHQLVARLAFVDFEDPTALREFDLQLNAPKIVEGIDKMIEWLTKLS